MDSVPSVGGRSTHCTGGFVERPPFFLIVRIQNGGQGDLLSLVLAADGFVYAANASGIFKVVPQ